MPTEPLAVHPLTFLLQTRGWGKAEFARLMQEHGRKLGLPLATNRTTVWKWAQGQEPDADAQRVLADLLGVPYEQARAEGWPRWLPVWEVTGLTAPWTEAGTVEALSDLVGSGRMDRRGFLTITGAALTSLAASWVDAPSAMAAALNGDRVTDTMVSTIEQRISTLRTLDDQLGGARLLEQARGDLALVTGLLGGGRYTDAVRIRLYALAARVSHLTGWMAYDAGLRSAGQRYYVGALRSARTTGDDAFGAFILAEMGVHVSEAGRTAERVGLVSTAIDNAPHSRRPAPGRSSTCTRRRPSHETARTARRARPSTVPPRCGSTGRRTTTPTGSTGSVRHSCGRPRGRCCCVRGSWSGRPVPWRLP